MSTGLISTDSQTVVNAAGVAYCIPYGIPVPPPPEWAYQMLIKMPGVQEFIEGSPLPAWAIDRLQKPDTPQYGPITGSEPPDVPAVS